MCIFRIKNQYLLRALLPNDDIPRCSQNEVLSNIYLPKPPFVVEQNSKYSFYLKLNSFLFKIENDFFIKHIKYIN